MLLTLACAFLGCTQPLPTAPDDALFLAQGVGGVSVAYYCGNTFQFRNRSLDSLTLQWRVHGVQESGELFLSGRGAAEYSETYLTTQERGPLQVSRGGQVLVTVPNKHTAQCEIPVTDTTRPALPDGFVWPHSDAIRTVQAAGDSMTPLYDNLVLIEFVESASGTSIRGLITGLRGTIVGGFSQAGYYVIAIPAVPTYDSLLTIVEAVRASPIVAGAMAAPYGEAVGRPFGVYPEDGARSPRASMRSASSADLNWSRVATRAPLAWGCEQGQSVDPVAIGVLDYYFDPTDPDLAPGATYIEPVAAETATPAPGTAANINEAAIRSHGQGVAGVAGAVGDNSVGVAGMVWRRNLRLYALTNGPWTIANFPIYVKDRLVPDLTSSGVRAFVASLSFGSADQTVYPELERRFLPYFQAGGVLVMPTDNYQGSRTLADLLAIRVQTGGLRRLSAAMYLRFPGQVWYVAGVDRSGHRVGTTFTGIEGVAAPAEDVLTLGRPVDFGGNADSAVRSPDGVSFAAPAVLGAAALLWSREPMKSGPAILNLLQDGALMDRIDPFTGIIGRPPAVAPGVGLIDIYSSLKAQAQASHLPLCGNRLWSVGHQVFADRNSGPELVGTVSDDVGQILPYHGGRKVLIQKGESARFAVHELGTGGVWDSTGLWDRRDSTGLAGSGLSALGFVHDRDSVAFLGTGGVKMGRSFFGPARSVGPVLTGTTSASGETCVVEKKEAGQWKCDVSVFLSATDMSLPSAVVTPVGETRLLWAQEAVKWETTVQAPWLDCWSLQPANDNSTCRFHERSTTVTPLGSSIWEMDRAASGNGTPRRVFDIPDNRLIASITASEDGGSVAIATGAALLPNSRMSDCQTQYYSYAPGQMSPSGPPVGYGTSCTNYNWQGGFGATKQQLTAAPQPPTDGFALQARLLRAVEQ